MSRSNNQNRRNLHGNTWRPFRRVTKIGALLEPSGSGVPQKDSIPKKNVTSITELWEEDARYHREKGMADTVRLSKPRHSDVIDRLRDESKAGCKHGPNTPPDAVQTFRAY